jgi:hypothetical protein
MSTPTPSTGADALTHGHGPRPARSGARATRALAGAVAAIALAGSSAAPVAAATSLKPDDDKSPGYQDLRNPDTRDAAEGRYPAPSRSDDGFEWGQLAAAAGGAGAVVFALGGLTRRRRATSGSTRATS